MAETVNLKALAYQILAREREKESPSQGCPNAGKRLGQSVGQPAGAGRVDAHGSLDLIAPFPRLASRVAGDPGLEQPCAARRGRVQELERAFLHFCCRCGRFGAFGHGVRLREGQFGRWYCGEHRPRSSKYPELQ
jgi:hypothetical protein